MFDVCIIGSGIVGSLCALKLSKYQLDVLLLDKDNDVGNEASSANSAIIHSGHDPKDNTLKSKLNIRGNQLWEELANELSIDFKRVGAFVVATNEDEEIALKKLYQRTLKRGIEAKLLDRNEAQKCEPHLSDSVSLVMSLPSTAIITPWEASVASVENAVDNSVVLELNQKVIAIEKKENCFEIKTESNCFEAKIIINSAGIYADDIYRLVSPQYPLHINPRRGEYFVLDRFCEPFISRVIYPMPSSIGKGILAVPTIHNNVLLGPNSENITDKEDIATTSIALNYVKEEIKKTIKDIPFDKVIRSYSGIRASIESEDFIIEEAKDIDNFINCIGIDSPGLASAPAIAEYIIENIFKNKIDLKEKENIVKRRPWTNINRLSLEERQAFVEKDKLYGHIICRCEHVSEAEIIDVIHRNAGARSTKAVKHRCRPGAGRCQGGFCEPRIIEILARELKIDPTEVVLDSKDSKILYPRMGEL